MPTTRSRREAGFSLLELSVALMVVAVLILIAIPMFKGVRDQSVETAIQTELRDALVPLKAHIMDGDPSLSLEDGVHEFSGTVRFDGGAVAGIKLQQATDGAVCMWRIAETGQVFGVWTPPTGGESLFTVQASLPSTCPEATAASGAGFAASW
jgi:prepilin-type N-terminal cleavage/methylation domain-containing protein